MPDILAFIWPGILQKAEFWSAIAGAIVGGLIAYVIQIRALREGRTQRAEDRQLVRQAQAHALLFKMIRIHSDFRSMQQHIVDCFTRGATQGMTGEPWQFFQPLANLPDPVHFTADEMGMLLGLKDNDVFNLVAPLDIVHNSFFEALRVTFLERRALVDALAIGKVEGLVVSGTLDPNSERGLRFRAKMNEVNTLIETLRVNTKRDVDETARALDLLSNLFHEKLGLAYKITPNKPLTNTVGSA
jgi:hypothetical protein